MSHFSQVRTKLSNREHLLTALKNLNLHPHLFEPAQPLVGYYGNQDKHSAEIVVAGSSIGTRADIGFAWNKTTNSYNIIHDEYETASRLGKNFFTHQLAIEYGKCAVSAKAVELQQILGECAITETQTGTKQTLRLTFADHQQIQHHRR